LELANITDSQTIGNAVVFNGVSVMLDGVTILDNISAIAPCGGSTAIIGPNGAGKTTLLLALLGQLPYTGHIQILCGAVGRRPRLGYVPQRLAFDRGLPMTVIEFMVMGKQRLPLWFGTRQPYRNRAMDLLSAVKADGLASRKLGALSGGELQRVLLALALEQEPDLLILDEPASGVDFQGEHIFCELLEQLRHELGFTQLMVSHDLATVAHHATHVICLNRKIAAAGPPQEVLTRENLATIFGIHMGLVDAGSIPENSRPECASCREKTFHA
jgi:zinc transport system ATP-binding protein